MAQTIPALLLALACLPAAAAAQTGWSEPAGVPLTVGIGGGMAATSGTTLYVIRGTVGGQEFYRRTLTPEAAWTRMADIPLALGPGSSITPMPGTSFLYLSTGAGTTKRGFYRYDTTADAWTPMTDLPFDAADGTALAATSTKVYALGAGFGEFTPDAGSGTWTSRTAPPSATGAGAALTSGPTGTLHAIRGAASAEAWRYTIATDTWSSLTALPGNVVAGGALAYLAPSSLLCMRGGAAELLRYDLSANTWAAIAASTVPAPTGAGAAIAVPPGGTTGAFILRGGATNHVWEYSVAGDRFSTALASAPWLAVDGSYLSGAGNPTDLYALRGGKTAEFYRYSMVEDRWTRLQDTPAPTGVGASLIWAGTAGLFATQGDGGSGAKDGFWRYDIASDAWTAMAPMSATQFHMGLTEFPAIGRAAWGGGDRIFVPVSTPYSWGFMIWYFISTNTWGYYGDIPPATYTGAGGLVYPGSGDYIYAYGGQAATFEAFSMSRNHFAVASDGSEFHPAQIPAHAAGKGATIVAGPGGSTLFALSGNTVIDDPDEGTSHPQPGAFWSYSALTNAWTALPSAPGSIGTGTWLAYPGSGPFLYALGGAGSRSVWLYGPNSAPDAPTTLAQFRADGITAVAAGGFVRTDALTLQAAASHPAGLKVRLQYEIVPHGSPFTGAVSLQSAPQTSGLPLRQGTAGLPLGDYDWRVRALGSLGKTSGWTEFAAAGPDFRVLANAAPAAGAIDQLRLLDGSPVIIGHAIADGVRLSARPVDANGDTLRVEFEVRPVGIAFTGTATSAVDAVAAGQSATIEERHPAGAYHWQARAIDEWGLAATAWTGFGGNDEEAADFQVLAEGSTGLAGCSQSAGAAPALLAVALLVAAAIRRV